MKFGNESQITLIAEEVGGAVAPAPPDAQIELFIALVEGCREAVEVGNAEPKVRSMSYKLNLVFQFYLGIL